MVKFESYEGQVKLDVRKAVNYINRKSKNSEEIGKINQESTLQINKGSSNFFASIDKNSAANDKTEEKVDYNNLNAVCYQTIVDYQRKPSDKKENGEIATNFIQKPNGERLPISIDANLIIQEKDSQKFLYDHFNKLGITDTNQLDFIARNINQGALEGLPYLLFFNDDEMGKNLPLEQKNPEVAIFLNENGKVDKISLKMQFIKRDLIPNKEIDFCTVEMEIKPNLVNGKTYQYGEYKEAEIQMILTPAEKVTVKLPSDLKLGENILEKIMNKLQKIYSKISNAFQNILDKFKPSKIEEQNTPPKENNIQPKEQTINQPELPKDLETSVPYTPAKNNIDKGRET